MRRISGDPPFLPARIRLQVGYLLAIYVPSVYRDTGATGTTSNIYRGTGDGWGGKMVEMNSRRMQLWMPNETATTANDLP